MKGVVRRVLSLFLVLAMVGGIAYANMPVLAEGGGESDANAIDSRNAKVIVDASGYDGRENEPYEIEADGTTDVVNFIKAAIGTDDAVGSWLDVDGDGEIDGYYLTEINSVTADYKLYFGDDQDLPKEYRDILDRQTDEWNALWSELEEKLDDWNARYEEYLLTIDESVLDDSEGIVPDAQETDDLISEENEEDIAPLEEPLDDYGIGGLDLYGDLDDSFGVDPDMGFFPDMDVFPSPDGNTGGQPDFPDTEDPVLKAMYAEYSELMKEQNNLLNMEPWYTDQIRTLWMVRINRTGKWYDNLADESDDPQCRDIKVKPGDVIEVTYSTMNGNDVDRNDYGVMMLASPIQLQKIVASIDPAKVGDPAPIRDQLKNNDFDSHPLIWPITIDELEEKYKDTYGAIKRDTDWHKWDSRFIITGNGSNLSNKIYAKKSIYNDNSYNAGNLAEIQSDEFFNRRVPNWQTTQNRTGILHGGTSNMENFNGIKSNFEWIYPMPTDSDRQWFYGDQVDFNDPFVELNASVQAMFYQDIGTSPGDIIVWSLMHAARSSAMYDASHNQLPTKPQEMSVHIGPATDETGKLTDKGNFATTDHEDTIYTKDTVYQPRGSSNPNGRKYGGDTTEALAQLSNLYLNNDYATMENNYPGAAVNKGPGTGPDAKPMEYAGWPWEEVIGVYTVPTGQSTTRFGFRSLDGGSSGNYLDKIKFTTLVGQVEITEEGPKVTVTGYLGDVGYIPDLVVEFEDTEGNSYTAQVDVSNVPRGSWFKGTSDALPDSKTPNASTGFLTSTGVSSITPPTPTPPSSSSGGGSPSSTVKLHFDKNGNSMAPNTDSQEGSKNFIGDYPNTLYPGQIIDGMKFTGWYTDKNGTQIFDFNNTPIERTTTVYAGWEKVDAVDAGGTPITDLEHVEVKPGDPNAITVDFVTEIGVTPDTQIKLPGLRADDPNAPKDPATLQPGTIIGDMMFMGWYIDEARTIPYNFNRVLSDSITLFAKWERVEGDAIDPPKQEGVHSPKTGYIANLSSTQMYLIIMLLAIMAIAISTGVVAYRKKD